MKKHNLTAKSLARTLMISSCALLSIAFPSAHAQNMDSQAAANAAAYFQANPQAAGSATSSFSGRNAGLPGAAGSVGATGLPSITNTRPDTSNYRPQQGYALPARPANTDIGSFVSYVRRVTGNDNSLSSTGTGTGTANSIDIFGKDLFDNVPDTFAPAGGAQVNPNYVIGSGDELQIRGWGMVDIDLSATVDRSGAIYIPRVGSVKVAGVKYSDLQEYLKKAVSKIFNNFDLTVSVAQTRAVQVYVVGHAIRPGTYTLSAMSTLLNALFVSGGPDSSGTMRNIQVKRGGQVVTSFDLYDILVKGDKTHDVALQDGDVIYIPAVGPLVALTGNVKKPAIFELKGASSVADVVAWAGGFDSATERKPVVVEKNVDNTYRTVAEVVADDSAIASRLQGIPLQPADILRVFAPSAIPVQAQIQNEYVRVSGEVRQTGVFRIKTGETLRELIARLGGVTENGYLYATKFNRESVRVMQQAQLNEVANRFERDLESNANQRLEATTDKDNIAAVNAEVARQRALAQKLRSIKAEGRIVLELENRDAQVKNLPDLALHDGDSIYVPRKPGTVDVLGAVFQQNAFIYRPHRSVKDYLALAGGPTVTADDSEIYLIRADGTTQSEHSKGWLSGLGGSEVNPGDTIVVPEKIERNTWTQSLKEWTSIFYQFGLGAAGLKVLKD